MSDLQELFAFAKKYDNLGTATQEQVDDMINGEFESVNPNAFKIIKNLLGGKNEELDSIIEEFELFLKEQNN